MKILTSTQIKAADAYTINYEPITSIDLMERASFIMAQWIEKNITKKERLFFLIGKGNNGGDGLAIARLLSLKGYTCTIYLAYNEKEFTQETYDNFKRFPDTIIPQPLDCIRKNDIVVDALLGTGTQGTLKEPLFQVISYINKLPNQIISIDIPSGMKSEWDNDKDTIIHADITLTLEFPKLAMLLPEAGECCGEIHILSIGLNKEFIDHTDTPFHFITKNNIKSLLSSRTKFAHKNNYGHSLLICGSELMPGAAILATGGVLKSGCGLVSVHTSPAIGYAIMHHFPSAMLSFDKKNHFSSLPLNISKYSTIGIGCGLGKATETVHAFGNLLDIFQKPMVIDADALNMIAEKPHLLEKIPPYSILTPHLGELKRLIGEWHSEKEKINMIQQLSFSHQLIIVVKGTYTMIVPPDGNIHFNPTGNSGMAKGGSGDVLTGIITGLLARGYDSIKAALIGVYIHGLAGDKATKKLGVESMNSHDIIKYLSEAFYEIEN